MLVVIEGHGIKTDLEAVDAHLLAAHLAVQARDLLLAFLYEPPAKFDLLLDK